MSQSYSSSPAPSGRTPGSGSACRRRARCRRRWRRGLTWRSPSPHTADRRRALCCAHPHTQAASLVVNFSVMANELKASVVNSSTTSNAGLGSGAQQRRRERRHPTGREGMGSPTPADPSRSNPCLRWLCFRGGGFPNRTEWFGLRERVRERSEGAHQCGVEPAAAVEHPSRSQRRPPPCALQKSVVPRAAVEHSSWWHRRPPPCALQNWPVSFCRCRF